MNKNFTLSVIKVLTLCIIVFAVSSFFIYDSKIIGWIILALGIFCTYSLPFFKIKIKQAYPDIMFGLIDNGILAVFAVIGGEVAGVAGAIIGGTVGNAITDGIAGIFEGKIAESLRKNKVSDERTVLGSAVGKMAGRLLGAGIVLIVAHYL